MAATTQVRLLVRTVFEICLAVCPNALPVKSDQQQSRQKKASCEAEA